MVFKLTKTSYGVLYFIIREQFLFPTKGPSQKKNGKNSDIMQKGGRGLHPNHYLRTLRNNDKSSMRGGLKVIVIFFIYPFLPWTCGQAEPEPLERKNFIPNFVCHPFNPPPSPSPPTQSMSGYFWCSDLYEWSCRIDCRSYSSRRAI